MVVPPKAAERVAEAKSSAMTMPGPDGWAIWTWLSMPPGSTKSPLASTISVALPRSVPRAVILPPLMPTSQAKVSEAVATVPPRIMVSKLIMPFNIFNAARQRQAVGKGLI